MPAGRALDFGSISKVGIANAFESRDRYRGIGGGKRKRAIIALQLRALFRSVIQVVFCVNRMDDEEVGDESRWLHTYSVLVVVGLSAPESIALYSVPNTIINAKDRKKLEITQNPPGLHECEDPCSVCRSVDSARATLLCHLLPKGAITRKIVHSMSGEKPYQAYTQHDRHYSHILRGVVMGYWSKCLKAQDVSDFGHVTDIYRFRLSPE